jgi:hypothetical protein
MTSYSPRIYIYKITFEEVPYYYYGVKKEKYFNQEYWGSPITNKWCWEFYTPKKQILQVFPYTDEGWIEAQEVENRLIRPVFNTDKWCLNENCGGIISLQVSRNTGKKITELGLGIHGRTKEQIIEDSKNASARAKELCVGIYSQSKEQLSENGKKGGKKAQKTFRNKKLAIYSISTEERKEMAAKTNSQRWMCLETEYVSTAAGVVAYQRKRGIDTSKRKRIE